MNIRINENFTIKGNINNYIVEQYGNKKEKVDENEYKDSFGLIKTTYHPSVLMALKHIIDKAPYSADVQSVQELFKTLGELENTLINLAKAVDIQ